MHGNCASCDESAGRYGFLEAAGISKTFDVPEAHSQVQVSMRVWRVDSPDNEHVFIAADGVTVWDSGGLWSTSCAADWTEWSSGGDFSCATWDVGFKVCYIDVVLDLAHTASTLTIAVTSNFDSNCIDESFGVSEVKIEYSPTSINASLSGVTLFDQHLVDTLTFALHDDSFALEHTNGAQIPAFHVTSTYDLDEEPRTTSLDAVIKNWTLVRLVDMQVGDCIDTDYGAVDPYSDGCDWYDSNSWGCGYYDDNDFTADDMCCACKDGIVISIWLQSGTFFDRHVVEGFSVDVYDDLMLVVTHEGTDATELPAFETTRVSLPFGRRRLLSYDLDESFAGYNITCTIIAENNDGILTGHVHVAIDDWTLVEVESFEFDTHDTLFVKGSSSMNYNDARQWCVDQGYALATIYSAEENEVARGVCGDDTCWIDLVEVGGDASTSKDNQYWQWADGSSASYLNWLSSEPQNHNGVDERNAIMNCCGPGAYSSGAWYDAPGTYGDPIPLCRNHGDDYLYSYGEAGQGDFVVDAALRGVTLCEQHLIDVLTFTQYSKSLALEHTDGAQIPSFHVRSAW